MLKHISHETANISAMSQQTLPLRGVATHAHLPPRLLYYAGMQESLAY